MKWVKTDFDSILAFLVFRIYVCIIYVYIYNILFFGGHYVTVEKLTFVRSISTISLKSL